MPDLLENPTIIIVYFPTSRSHLYNKTSQFSATAEVGSDLHERPWSVAGMRPHRRKNT